MVKAYLHGSSMLYYTPVEKKQIRWDTKDAWCSALELACKEWDVAEKENKCLLVDLSYTISAPVAYYEGKYYTVNAKNKDRREVKEKQGEFSFLNDIAGEEDFEEKFNTVKSAFDQYIKKVKEKFEQVILVRIQCPKRSITKFFVQNYQPLHRDKFNMMIRKVEDYFIEKVSPIVVDISNQYYFDVVGKKHGVYTSYEQNFYLDMSQVLHRILVKKEDCRLYRGNYKYVIKRYLKYYDIAKERNEEYLLMGKELPIERLIRAMNKEMVQKYAFELAFVTNRGLSRYHEILQQEELLPAFVKFVRSFCAVIEHPEDEIPKDIEDMLGIGMGLELEILAQTRNYYVEQGLLPLKYINLTNLKEFYFAMKLAKQGKYIQAIGYVNEAIALLGKRPRKYKAKSNCREELGNALAFYANNSEPIGIDFFGKYISTLLYPRQNSKYELVRKIIDVEPWEEGREEAFERMRKSTAQWIVVDIYSVIAQSALSEEEIKRALDVMISFLTERYGSNIIFHKLQIKTEYTDLQGDVQTFWAVEKLKEDNEKLQKYQQYFTQHCNCHVIDLCGEHKLNQHTYVMNEGINYDGNYFSQAREVLKDIVEKNEEILKYENFVNAYVNMNLGDDLFLAILAKRYPDRRFTVLAKNKYVAKGLEKYPNLETITDISLGQIKKIKNNIFIGGSVFLQNRFWKLKLEERRRLIKKSSKNYILGANFGPYTENEFVDCYRELYKQCDDVVFRDTYSADLFSDIAKVRVAGDIVFSQYQELSRYANKDGKGVVISVIKLENRDELSENAERYYDEIAQVAREFMDSGEEVTLMSFCDNEGDGQAMDAVLNCLGDSGYKERIKLYHYDGDLEESLEVLGNSKYIVASRFHAIVLGLLLEKIVYPLLYSDKSLHMLNDIGFQGAYADIRKMRRISMGDVKGNGTRQLLERKEKLMTVSADAQKQFMILDKIL